MEDGTRNRRILYIVLVVLGLLISCGVGAMLGGAAGFLMGRRSAVLGQGRLMGPGLTPRLVTPAPVIPGVPRRTPDLELPSFGEGAMVMSVVEGSPAEAADLRRGDIILSVDDRTLDEGSDLRDVLAEYEPGDEIQLTVRRGSRELQLSVELGANPDPSVTSPWLGISYVMLAAGD